MCCCASCNRCIRSQVQVFQRLCTQSRNIVRVGYPAGHIRVVIQRTSDSGHHGCMLITEIAGGEQNKSISVAMIVANPFAVAYGNTQRVTNVRVGVMSTARRGGRRAYFNVTSNANLASLWCLICDLQPMFLYVLHGRMLLNTCTTYYMYLASLR